MTLPFRRRHHDDEAGHDRARSLVSREMLEPISGDEATWLERHLEACQECRRDREGFLADRDLLRSLRGTAPEPPRDLWARTSAAIDREARARGRRDTRLPGRDGSDTMRRRALPFGAAAGALVVLVVVGTSIIPPTPRPGPIDTPGASAVGNITPVPQPTNITLDAGDVAWIQPDVDGNWKLYRVDVDEVCPRTKPGCSPLGANQPGQPIDLGKAPTGVTISPTADQLVVESPGDATNPGKVYVVPVPGSSVPPTPVPPSPSIDIPTTEPSVIVSPDPGSPAPTPGSTPSGGIEIASGVAMVGEAAYSEDGAWLAFSARPSDGSTGPDLYLWHVGDPTAVAVTTDHQTYFSAWHDGRVLASRIATAGPATPDPATPGASGEPAASRPPASNRPAGQTPASQAPAAATDPVASDDPGASDAPRGLVEAHPISFLLDPSTLVATDLPRADVWLPVVDPTGRFTAYWSGTVVPMDGGVGWQLGTGQLVLDRWLDAVVGPEPGTSGQPAESAEAPASPVSSPVTSPVAPAGQLGPGPAGAPIPLVAGPTADFMAKFDPDGLRLALWVGEDAASEVGRLHLLVIDPENGTIDAGHAPLPGTPALRRFSMETGRLAWVNPRGQDGQESTVQVLGWSKNNFGEIRTIPARDLFIVR
jgi:hypothetical protein